MKKILIADDETRIRRLVADFLRQQGFVPLEAGDGREALDLIEQHNDLALAILDVMMPNTTGDGMPRDSQKSQLLVIALTFRSQESDELFGFELGADEYITALQPQVLWLG